MNDEHIRFCGVCHGRGQCATCEGFSVPCCDAPRESPDAEVQEESEAYKGWFVWENVQRPQQKDAKILRLLRQSLRWLRKVSGRLPEKSGGTLVAADPMKGFPAMYISPLCPPGKIYLMNDKALEMLKEAEKRFGLG